MHERIVEIMLQRQNEQIMLQRQTNYPQTA